MTLVGSRFTHAAESRYAPIEGEALAVVDALDKARYFVLGCEDLIVAVDHKPLLKLLADRALGRHTQPPPQEPQGENPALSLPHRSYPGHEEQGGGCHVT